jgi:hypothetical protein
MGGTAWVFFVWLRKLTSGLTPSPAAATVIPGEIVVDIPPPILALPAPARRMPVGIRVCEDENINARVEALFDKLEREYGTN